MSLYALPIAAALVFTEFATKFDLCEPTTVQNVLVRANAIRAAEEFVRQNKLDTQRECPAQLAALDSQRGYEVQAICPYYQASESKAYDTQSIDEFGWKIFFRKLRAGSSPMRTVVVYPPDARNREARACLRDGE